MSNDGKQYKRVKTTRRLTNKELIIADWMAFLMVGIVFYGVEPFWHRVIPWLGITFLAMFAARRITIVEYVLKKKDD